MPAFRTRKAEHMEFFDVKDQFLFAHGALCKHRRRVVGSTLVTKGGLDDPWSKWNRFQGARYLIFGKMKHRKLTRAVALGEGNAAS
jgi:hypothetical protein